VSYQVPVIEIRFLLKLGEHLHGRGFDMDGILHDMGLDSSLLDQPWTHIPLSVAGRILDILAKQLADDALGLHLGAKISASSGMLGHLMMAAPTVRGMLEAFVQFHDLHLQNVDIRLCEQASGGRLEFAYPACAAGPSVQLTGFFMASLVTAIRAVTGPGWTPRAVEFDHRLPTDLAPYTEVLGPRLKFGRSVNALVVDRASLALRSPLADARLFETLREAGARLRAEPIPVHDIVSQVHREISSRLATAEPFDLECIADTLGLTARALQYRLEIHHTSYEAILIDTRRRLAERYLRDTDLAITEISARLGFSELSAFTRAAHRWFHMPPRTYRNHMRGPAGEARPMAAGYARTVKATAQPGRGGSARRSRGGSGSPAPMSSRT